MSRIIKPSPPEHLVIVDTNILWTDDKTVVVNLAFDAFWDKYSLTFPMELIIPDVVRGELLFQQVSSASKALEKANQHFQDISRVTSKSYSHRLTHDRIKREVEERFEEWRQTRKAEVKAVPVSDVDWLEVINNALWRILPFTGDPKNPKNEKGFRDCMILETVCSVCRSYSADVNIAFVCDDFPLRQAADARLGKIASFSTYESLTDFESFIELTRKNLTERFVKSILTKAREKFHSENDDECLLYKGGLIAEIRVKLGDKMDHPVVPGALSFFDSGKQSWKHIGAERVWITRPQFQYVEGENVYHWNSRVTYYRLYERDETALHPLLEAESRRLVTLGVDVHWKATVRSDGRFFKCKVVDYREATYQFEPPKEEELVRYLVLEPRAQVNAPPGSASPEKGSPGSESGR
jgi:PIN domain